MPTLQSVRPLLEPWGTLRSQPPSGWTGQIPLPEPLKDFYLEVGPWGETFGGPVGLTISAGGNSVCLPPLHKLWDAHSGYRWNGHTGDRLPDWKDEWFLVAEQGGDPFILDGNTGQVLFDRHGSGGWSPECFAEDIATAFGSIATVANTFSELGDDALDDTFELKSSSRELVRNALAGFLGGDMTRADATLHAWRWYE